MIYTGLSRTGEIVDVKAHGGGDISEVYGGIGEMNPIYYKSRTITGTLPLSYKALGKPLSDYLIEGNTIQSGTPSHEAPVDVVGCGVRTENFWNYTIVQGGWFAASGTIPTPSTPGYINYTNRCRVQDIIPIPSNTMFLACPSGIKINFVWIDANGVSMGGSGWQQSSSTVTAPENAITMTFILAKSDDSYCSPNDFQNIMINLGYKLPPTVNGTEHPIYLGQVESTRRVRKLVLTGEEQVRAHQLIVSWFQIFLTDIVIDGLELCTHYKTSPHVPSNMQNGEIFVGKQTANDEGRIVIKDAAYTTADDFKSYLAAQYAAGTPVTVWYVLAEPETGIVNEPLHKIGNYADTISMTQASITIPTTTGTNTFTIPTTAPPSSISINGNIKPESY